ncbi:MAG: NUDIX domain-containing protein [Anaerolineae bacterium]|nr:NUDIX domain-containing protein [Anaerolineae bacterium]
MVTLNLKHKVYAYITHANRLLVFRHVDGPDAGIQVPGGTMEEDEAPEDAVMREAFEETGLRDLRMRAFLGDTFHAFPEHGVTHHRHFYNLVCDETPSERWRHDELDPSDGSPAPITFEFTWVLLPDGVPKLMGNLDEMLPALCGLLELDQRQTQRR